MDLRAFDVGQTADKRVSVVIPVFKPSMTTYERLSFNRCIEVLHHYDIILVAPSGLDLAGYQVCGRFLDKRRFPRSFFRGISAYNHLLLSLGFYEAFLEYDYILLYQLDAFVFRDELANWCSRGYDYIGAPWPDGMEIRPATFRGHERLARVLPFPNQPVLRHVGNGGFSLRNVRACHRLLGAHQLITKIWSHNEDAFFALYGSRYDWFNIPNQAVARQFAFEKDPRESFHLNGDELPFGCHAWAKWDIEFWRPAFGALGYTI